MHDLVVVELFDVEYYCDLEMWVEVIQNLTYGFLFAFYSNYGCICICL